MTAYEVEVMATTGWTHEQLREQPAPVVRGLMHRAFVRAAWDAEVARAARTPVGHRSDYRTAQDWGDAYRAHVDANKSLREIESALWPEDDDG